MDTDGKLIIESLKDYTKRNILQEFRSLDDFLTRWNSAEKKKTIIEELEAHKIILENLQTEVKKELDIFDLVCHIAWDMPALTRRERVEKARKTTISQNMVKRRGRLLKHYWKSMPMKVLKTSKIWKFCAWNRFSKMGTPTEIVQYVRRPRPVS